jgi:hypothetical protein
MKRLDLFGDANEINKHISESAIAIDKIPSDLISSLTSSATWLYQKECRK